MKIEKIHIGNFKAAESIEIRPARVNFMVGPNGTGKSSIMEAIRYGLTGEAPAHAVTGNRESASVELTLENIGTLQRSCNANGRSTVLLNGKKTTAKSIEALFTKQSGVPSKVSGLLTSSKDFFALNGSGLASFLLDGNLVRLKLQIADLLALCNLSDKAEEELTNTFSKDKIRLADIDNALAEFKTRRRVLKQQIKEAQAKAQYDRPEPEYSMEKIDKSLLELSKKQGAFLAEQKQYQTAISRRAQMLQEIEKRKASIGRIIEKPDEKQLKQAMEDLKYAEKGVREVGDILAVITENGKRLSKILEQLSKSVCPFSKKVQCTADKTAALEEINQSVEAERERYKQKKAEIAQLQKKCEKTRKWIEDFHQTEKAYDLQALTIEHIGAMEQNLPDIPEVPIETGGNLQKQMKQLNLKKAEAIRYQEAFRNRSVCEQLLADLNICEEIVKNLDPKNGIRKRAIEQSVGPLEDYLNQRLIRLLPKYRIKIDCAEGFKLKLQDENGELEAFASASDGERTRLNFVLMDMVNTLLSYRILLFDSTDAMDAQGLSEFVNLLQTEELLQNYDHIFVSIIDYAEVNASLEKMKGDFLIIHTPFAESEGGHGIAAA